VGVPSVSGEVHGAWLDGSVLVITVVVVVGVYWNEAARRCFASTDLDTAKAIEILVLEQYLVHRGVRIVAVGSIQADALRHLGREADDSVEISVPVTVGIRESDAIQIRVRVVTVRRRVWLEPSVANDTFCWRLVRRSDRAIT